MAKYMEELEDMLCEELDKIGKEGKLTAGNLDAIQKLTHSLKSIKTIEAMEEGGYSRDYSGRMYPMYYGNSYEDGNRDMGGNSYARGRGSNARRDSMGRYSRNYSRDDGMVEELRELMEDAPNQHIKQKMQSLITEIERM